MKENRKKIGIYVSEDTYNTLKALADKEKRSISAQCVYLIEAKLEEDKKNGN